MEKRRIGSLEVSVVGLGCNNFGWRIDKSATKAVVDAALDMGVNFFDTADIYGTGQSEDYLGEALGSRRNDIVLATKFGMSMGEGKSGASRAYVIEACEASLRRLKTDHIDLYQLHTPDATTRLSETLEALDALVRAGKVREIGCSNFSADQLRDAAAVAKTAAAAKTAGAPKTAGAAHKSPARFVAVQNHYSLFHRAPEGGVLEECARQGIGLIPYFPLANGLLSGKYRKGQPLPEHSRGKDAWGPNMFSEKNLELIESLIAYAEARGHSLLELAVSWLASNPVIPSVIGGAKTAEQVKANSAAAVWKLSPAQFAEIETILSQ
jgi:aryl-alcohol dehydrogenase-like predicted oxidoreductase